MKLSNAINENIDECHNLVAYESISTLIKLLAPFAPHLAEELWRVIGGENSIHLEAWPEYCKNALEKDSLELIVQIKGKVRGKLNIPYNLDEVEAKKIVLESQIAKKWLNGKDPSRIIFVPNKLINLVP